MNTSTYPGSILITERVLLELFDGFSLSRTKPFALEAIKRIYRLPMLLVVGFDAAVLTADHHFEKAGFPSVCSSNMAKAML